jgi:hypothetical protein
MRANKSNERFKRTAINLMTGKTVELQSLHGPLRTVEGDPEKAARKVARKAAAPLRAARLAVDVRKAPAPVTTPPKSPAD